MTGPYRQQEVSPNENKPHYGPVPSNVYRVPRAQRYHTLLGIEIIVLNIKRTGENLPSCHGELSLFFVGL